MSVITKRFETAREIDLVLDVAGLTKRLATVGGWPWSGPEGARESTSYMPKCDSHCDEERSSFQ